MNRWILHPLLAALIGVWAAGAQAERRVALVIGNSAYQEISPLANSAVDARSMQLEFWQSIKGSDDAADFEAYLAQYPDGTFAALARNRIKALVAARTAAAPTRDSGSTARIAGEWVSEVLVNPFEKSNKYRLHFRFKVIGDRLLGTVVEKSAPAIHGPTRSAAPSWTAPSTATSSPSGCHTKS